MRIFKKNFKYFCILILLIIILIICFLFYKSSSKEKLILVCEHDVAINEKNINISLNLYKKSKNLILIQSINMDNIESDYLNILKKQLNKKIENQFGKNYKYVTIDSKYTENGIIIDIIYNINKENNKEIEKVVGCSILDTSTTEIKNCFEKGKLKCAVH